MNSRTLVSFLLCIVFSYATAMSSEVAAARKPAGWHSGVGTSFLPDARLAGEAAAAAARAALGDVEPKFVMVMAARPLVTDELIAGVATHFPVELIFGSEVTSVWTPDGNNANSKTLDTVTGVGVWAVGGDVDIMVAGVSTGDWDEASEEVLTYYQAGLELAALVRPAFEESTRPGRLLLTWGDQFTGSNKAYARGLNEGLGAIWPIVGGAAGGADAKVISRGEIGTGLNIGVVLAGDFKIGQAKRTGPHTPKTTELAFEDALRQGDGEEPFFGLLFNCRRRRVGMMNEGGLAEEQELAKKYLAKGDFFGFYAPGEIGSASSGEPAEGVGFSVTMALLFAL